MSDCSNHKKDIAGIADMKRLAEMIGDLHYETLSDLLEELSIKLANDSAKDFSLGRVRLYKQLKRAAYGISKAKNHIAMAGEISKPHMKK